MFSPTPQQEQFFRWAREGTGSARLKAVAGAGKTTTLVRAATEYMSGTVALVAYNKSIALELDRRVVEANARHRIKAGTFHSFGFSAWRSVADRGVKVEGRKIITLLAKESVPYELQKFVETLVSLAKQHILLPTEPDLDRWTEMVEYYNLIEKLNGDERLVEDGVALTKRVLAASNAQGREVIDFDDMIYLPVVHDVPTASYDWVLVDEAQDTNPARRALAAKMLKKGGRFVAVGDPGQAIYGFTGADADAFDQMAEDFGCEDFDLTVSFRCARNIVSFAQRWFPTIEAAPSAPEGTVRAITMNEFGQLPASSFTPDSVVLCRVTKPLVEMAYSLIRRKIGCTIEGRDIGNGLVVLAKKWRSVRTARELAEKLEEWLPGEVARLLKKGRETAAEHLTEQVDALMVILEAVGEEGTVEDVAQEIRKLFADTNGARLFTLSTVHKAKGREWERVYLLQRSTHMPSRWARKDWQQEQERNLIYVAVTRAKMELVEVG